MEGYCNEYLLIAVKIGTQRLILIIVQAKRSFSTINLLRQKAKKIKEEINGQHF